MPWLQRRLNCLRAWRAGLVCGLMLMLAPVLAQLTVPTLTSHVIDTTATLTAAQSQALENKLQTFEQSRGTQVVVLLVPTTQPEDIASYANRVANTWKIGRREIGDGLLLVVAKNDRKVRIEVAKTLEGAIPDLAAQRIIDQSITPRFKQGDFAGGLDAGVSQLIARVSGEALPAPSSAVNRQQTDFDWMDLAVFAFLVVPFVGAMARRALGPKLGAVATGGAVGGLVLLITSSLLIAALAAFLALVFTLFSNLPGDGGSGSGWGTGSGGGWHSGSSGGFGSGGGGDFGGGGASGDW